MGPWAPVVILAYLGAGAVAGWWSFQNGNHRPEASTAAKVVSSVVVGLVWPGIVVDLWLLDAEGTRRSRKNQ